MGKTKSYLTFKKTLNIYFGGIKEIALKPLPFQCRVCKSTRTTLRDKKTGYSSVKYHMGIKDIWFHIRRDHKEVVKKKRVKKDKPVQSTI